MQPPEGPDPNGLTQPLPTVKVIAAEPIVAATPPPVKPAPFDHRFGNVGSYLLLRLLAFALDVFAVSFVVATFLLGTLNLGTLTAARDAGSFTMLMLLSFGGALLLLLITEGLFGTSLGKLIFGLKVRRRDGGWAGPGRALVRMLLRPLDILLIGPLLALILPKHQRVGDLFAGTVVGRSALGPFATIIGLVLVALIGYAQVTYGGGVTSALAVTAEASTYLPQWYERVAGVVSLFAPAASGVKPGATPAPSLAPDATPAADTTPASDATDAPEDTPAAAQPTPGADATPIPG